MKHCYLAVAIVLLSTTPSPAAVFTPLGDLPGGAFHSEATRISADGSTVVGWGTSAAGREAFRWTLAEGMVGLGHLPNGSQDSIAYGVSGDGKLIAGFSDGSAKAGLQAEGFYWTAEEGMKSLGFLNGGAESRARAVSADASTIVGWSRSSAGIEAFRWNRDDGMISLGDLDGGIVGGAAQNVNEDGSYIVGYGTTDIGRQPVYWSNNTIGKLAADIGDYPGTAWEINPDGSAVGEMNTGQGRQAIIFEPSGTDFGSYLIYDLPGGGADDAAAYGLIRSDSEFQPPLYVVGTGSTDVGYESFIWSEWFGMKRFKDVAERNFGLDLTGWQLTTTLSAAKTNRIGASNLKNAIFVGTGIDPQGNEQAWMIDFAATRTTTLDSAPGWLESPRGVFDFASSDRFEIATNQVPLNADLWSPPFTIPEGSTPVVEFSYLWDGSDDSGGLAVELVPDDNPTQPSAYIANAAYVSEKTTFSQSVPTGSVVPKKKYRIRFRYYDQDEKELSLGPLSLENVVIQGVDFSVDVPGDTNDDGQVNIADLNNVRNNFGGTGLGDTNGDNLVTIEDLNLVRNNFGTGAASGAVPEPSTAALLAVASVLSLGVRGCRRRARAV